MKTSALVILLIIFGGLLVVLLWLFPLDRNDQMTACTLEALVCPDGSAVGRSGLECTFSPCPQQPFFEGVLEQTSDGFQLVLDTSPGLPEGSPYTIPLEVRVSNALQDFVNTEVRVYGAFSEGNTYRVETLEAASESEARI